MKPKSESNRIRHSTPQHRRSVRRRMANRARIMATVLGALSLLFAIFFLIMSLWRDALFPTARSWQMCFAYAGIGLFLFLMRYLLGRDTRRKLRNRATTSRHASSRKSGMILLLTLVLLGVISALALYLQQAAFAARQADLRHLERTQLRLALLDEGFARLQELADDVELDVDHLEKEWLSHREVERADGIVTLSRIRDLNRYIDINNLYLPDEFAGANQSETMLVEAMTQAGDFTPLERLVAIRDWIDPDDEGIRESAFYLEKNPGYEVANTWLHSWSELLWIEGFTPDYFQPPTVYRLGRAFEADINTLMTLIPTPREQPIPININTAAPELLAAIAGPDHERVARFIQLTRIDRPIRSIDALQPYLQEGALPFLRPFLDVRSTYFVLEMMAAINRHHGHARVIAERDDQGRVHILQWVMN